MKVIEERPEWKREQRCWTCNSKLEVEGKDLVILDRAIENVVKFRCPVCREMQTATIAEYEIPAEHRNKPCTDLDLTLADK